MEEKIKSNNLNHTVIQTRHVYSENEKVFFRDVTPKVSSENESVAEWFPTNFKWVSI